jgi:signal transduction histidine kinase
LISSIPAVKSPIAVPQLKPVPSSQPDAKHLPIPGVVQPISLELLGSGYALVMEDVGGIPLGQYAKQQPLALTDILAIAIQIAETLHALCNHRMVHKDISTSLRTFSRADTDHPVACNIHDGIDSTILILKHRLKGNSDRPEIQVITDYGDLPLVECYAEQLNQVFMNLLANAIEALDESSQGRSFDDIKANPNQITIKTELTTDRQAVIRIQDNGKGMTEAVQAKIFDHLFTTKDVGKGTGLGLAIARQIVVEKHGGNLDVQSELGKGTQFLIQLPIQGNVFLG